MGFGSEFNPFNPGGKGFGRELDKLRESISETGKRSSGQSLGRETSAQDTYEEIYRTVLRRLVEFEDRLPPEQEVAMQLSSFGQAITFRVADLSHHRPGLIVFYGADESGGMMELVQHAHQLSFLLIGAARSDASQPRPEKPFRRLHSALLEKLESLKPEQRSEEPGEGPAGPLGSSTTGPL